MEMTVLRSVTDGVATVTINRPRRRNALDRSTASELVVALDEVESAPDVRAIVITGAGPAFCAGADLRLLGEADEADLRAVYEGFVRVARSPLPTLAAVNGPAVGAGLNLALACDMRLAARSARFDARFLSLGVHPGGGHTWLLQRAVGPALASTMVLFGEVLDGEAAARVGLAHRCVPDEDLLAEAARVTGRLSPVPRELVTRTKATLTAIAAVGSHAEAVERELGDQLWSMAQPGFTLRGDSRKGGDDA